MEQQKLLIADGTEAFELALADALKESYCIRSCGNGRQALELLRSFRPDIFVLDLMLPELDGLSLLEAAAAEGLRPRTLATTRFASDYVSRALTRLGVDYLIMKPCGLGAVVDRINDMQNRESSVPAVRDFVPDPETQIHDMLLKLGIATNCNGYDYLEAAMPMMIRNPGLSYTKELYPVVGAQFGRPWKYVEHSIRDAIEDAWERRDRQVWDAFFRNQKNGTQKRPTNAAFMTRLLADVKLPKKRA